MSQIRYGVELPNIGSGLGSGAPVNPFDLALAKAEVEITESYTVAAGFQYIRFRDFTINGTFTVDGELIIL